MNAPQERDLESEEVEKRFNEWNKLFLERQYELDKEREQNELSK